MCSHFMVNKFSCYLIGEDNLANSCVKIILEHGYTLLGICSPSEQIRDFANQNNIPYTNSLEVFESWLQANKCDFLFSIVNSRILSKDIIKLPRYFSINYHNAALPKYAGVHATSWAILNNERSHGVTWHVMDRGIDTGDILKQAIFEIYSQETNFTLDIKCIEKAIPLFRNLLEELVNGEYKKTKQDLNQRSYYTLYQKPKYWGLISWVSSTANEIYVLFRALNFPGHANKLCLPKLVFNNVIFFAKQAAILSKKKKLLPGTVVELTADYLRVSTITDDIVFSQLADINGKSYSISEFADLHGIKENKILSSLDQSFLLQLEQHSELLAKSESFWIRTLEQIKSPNFWSFNHNEDIARKKVNTIKTIIYSNKCFKDKIMSLLPADVDATDALITIFFLYLYRLNNYDNFSVGYECKFLEEIETDMHMFFANIVPINLSFTSETDFYQAVSKVNELLKLINQHKTFAKDVMLRYPQLTGQSISFPLVVSTIEPVGENHSEISGYLYFVINEEGIILYSPDNLDKTNQKIIDSMNGHLQVLVDEILLNKSLPIKKLSILTQQENQLILEDWNNTATYYPRKLSLPKVFEQQANRYPNNIAVKYNNTFLTYQELNIKANQLAFYLSGLGIKNGSLVAIYFDKGINSILGILSILKTGAAYVPLDTMSPKQHIKYILEDTEVSIILTQEKNREILEECLPSRKFTMLSIDDPNADLTIFNGQNIQNLTTSIRPTSLAYIMYTSGSTGVPKGVVINHRAIIRLVKDTNYIQFASDDSVAQAASISFDASTFEIWGALLNGAKLVCAGDNTILDAESFARFLHDEKINILWLTSALFDQYASVKSAMFKELKYLLVGGDVLNADAVYSVINCPTSAPLCMLNGYGPTENTTFTTTFSIRKNFDKNKSIPIGQPIANTTVYVLDKYLNPMPAGIPGELCVGGDGLSLGYWHKETMTKEKFIDVILNNKKIKLYKIGDLVRWLADGNLEYICRLDNQVKIRGFRIELEAIELCLLNCDMVSQCAVIVQQDKKMHKMLTAYLVVKSNGSKDISFIRQFLTKHLPPYMVPNMFITMDKLPLTLNGKVDKKSLPLKLQEQIPAAENCIYPRNELENKLADIWKELLNLDIISVNDNFFHLGGHSLLITEMLVKIKKQINADFPLHAFLETPNLANLARLIETQHHYVSTPNTLRNIDQAFLDDTFLDPKIKPPSFSRPLPIGEELKAVLLTGVTGFLGVYLLNDLYRLSSAKIYCLVRASSLDDAHWRLKQILNAHKLDESMAINDRVVVMVGDLAKPLLGLDQVTFDMLSEEIDYIYHCGAYVHHIYNYEMLRETNVLSTLEIIKLAVNKKNKHIHYVSTLSTAVNCNNNRELIVKDFFDENKLPLDMSNGYVQTKLASEIILAKAYERDISVSIYRPSWIVGHECTGICPVENNHLFLLLKGCVQMGLAPKLELNLNLLPVDFVSNMIIKISLNMGKAPYQIFNLVNQFTVTWSELFEYMNDYGHKVKLISATDWRQKHLAKIDRKNAAYPLMALYFMDGGIDWAASQNNFLNINDHNTVRAMKTLGLSYTKIDEVILKRYFDFFHQSGFMPLTGTKN
ncbi:Peptide synthetase, non-ribosomal [Gammaproteobacteria bacterium]